LRALATSCASYELDSFGITHAILGNPAVRIPVGPGAPPDAEGEPIASRDGVMLRERRYVSAVVVVHTHTPQRADVYETGDENAAPLPKEMFNDGRGARFGYLPDGRYGPLDER
jgi:hypothetical protein